MLLISSLLSAETRGWSCCLNLLFYSSCKLHCASVLDTSRALLLAVINSCCQKTALKNNTRGLCHVKGQSPLLLLFNVLWEMCTECFLHKIWIRLHSCREKYCVHCIMSVLSIKLHSYPKPCVRHMKKRDLKWRLIHNRDVFRFSLTDTVSRCEYIIVISSA